MHSFKQRAAIAVAVVTLALAGCAGGGSTRSNSSGNSAVQGVSTPDSVAVVTATNAD